MSADAISHAQPRAELIPAIRERWSPRAFDPVHTLTPEELSILFDAARWAPSAGNSQPWAFLAGLRGDATFEAFHALLSRGNTVWAGRASALLLTLHQTAVEPGSKLPYSDYAAYDLGQATAQLALQAQSMGLHSHQFAGFDHERAREQFEVPEHWTVTTGIALGHLAAADTLPEPLALRERAPRSRKPTSAFVFAEAFGAAA